MNTAMQKHATLLVVDIQPDFCPRGPLAVPGGEDIIPLINQLAQKFETVVLTQDWHPADHISFAANHPSRIPFETIQLPYGEQVLWPTHCVMDTPGAALHPDLHIPHAALVQRKGSHRHVDSYSAFLEADRTTTTGLDGYLQSLGIEHVYLCGLATDFCVAWSAEDAHHFGFAATIIEDACRAIDLDGSLAAAWRRLSAAGVARRNSREI
jgi:nicotinamidase/pyrazinamidase